MARLWHLYLDIPLEVGRRTGYDKGLCGPFDKLIICNAIKRVAYGFICWLEIRNSWAGGGKEESTNAPGDNKSVIKNCILLLFSVGDERCKTTLDGNLYN